MKPFHENLIDRLVDIRVLKPSDQKRWLASKTGVSIEGARKWLIGDNEPAQEHMEAIAKALGMSVVESFASFCKSAILASSALIASRASSRGSASPHR